MYKRQLYALGIHISPYEKGNIFNKEPRRPRRLLMHKREINRLYGLVKKDGYALVPLSLYFKGPHVKVQVALAKGKKLYDCLLYTSRLSSDRRLQPACVKSELLVIADQHAAVNTFPGLVHTARHTMRVGNTRSP